AADGPRPADTRSGGPAANGGIRRSAQHAGDRHTCHENGIPGRDTANCTSPEGAAHGTRPPARQNGRVPSTKNDQERRVGGRYRLSSELGSGAMGTVWSGYDDVLQRRVAIKELKVPPGVPEQEARDLRERIMREARALGGLSHPNVITVFDVVV